MSTLLQIALVNAVLATLLACLVALIGRKVRRPALTHALWVVVLMKLVTPPLFEVPIDLPVVANFWPAPAESESSVPPPWVVANASCEGNGSSAIACIPVTPAANANLVAPVATSGTGRWSAFVDRIRATASAAGAAVAEWIWSHPVSVLVWLWLAGSAIRLTRQGVIALRFSRRLALAMPAPDDLQEQADRLAAAMGLSCRPPVLIVRDVISPMLWGVGRNARLLFPLELLARLDASGRQTLIAHELAHFRRGDHWVRAFELVVSAIYWWHPVVWWARREIEIAEEECCDAWVVEQFPETPRCYAEALLETLDFLSEEPLVLPPAAAGLGHVPLLRRRLTAIMRGVAPKTVSGPAQWAGLLAATMVLPLHPAPGRAALQPRLLSRGVVVREVPEEAAVPADELTTALVVDALSEPLAAEVARVTEPRPFPLNVNLPWATATSPDGRFSIARRKDAVFLNDAETGKSTDLTEYRILTVAFSTDGKMFATGDDAGTVRLWASSTGEMLKAFRGGHADRVQGVAFIHDGLDLVSAGRDGTIRLWNIELGSELATLMSQALPINCLTVSPDGRWLAAGAGSWKSLVGDGRILVWDLRTLQERAVFDCQQPVGALVFKPDSNLILAGAFGGYVSFWSLSERREIGTTLPRYKDAVAALQFSADTRALSHLSVEDIYRQPLEVPGPGSFFWSQSASVSSPAGGTGRLPVPSGNRIDFRFGANRPVEAPAPAGFGAPRAALDPRSEPAASAPQEKAGPAPAETGFDPATAAMD